MKAMLTVLLVVLLLLGVAFIFPFEVRTDYAFICDTTGSRYGYTHWFFGGRSSSWYQQSGLEAFIKAHHPAELQHRWNGYSDTGRDIFGRSITFRCGAAPPLLFLPPEFISAYCAQISDEEKLRLFRSLVSADRQEAKQIADTILGGRSGGSTNQPQPQTIWTNLFE